MKIVPGLHPLCRRRTVLSPFLGACWLFSVRKTPPPVDSTSSESIWQMFAGDYHNVFVASQYFLSFLLCSFLVSVANVQSHLAAAVPPADQILLLGPPYKVPKDSTLQSEDVLQSLRIGDAEDDPIVEEPVTTTKQSSGDSGQSSDDAASASSAASTPIHNNILSTTERSGARRLFLFSKQALSQSAPEPPVCSLEPKTLQLPSHAPGQSPLEMSFSSAQPPPGSSPPGSMPPLHQALTAYERQFMLSLGQGRVLADGADMRLRACRQCVQEQAIMARALRAAVSNLSDHFNGAARTRSQFTNTFQVVTAKHASLLQRFESILTSLQSIPLHPALVGKARASGRVMETLLDTVPVEPERAWAAQCQTSHQRLMALFEELDNTFASLGTPAQRDEEARKDLAAEHEIQTAWVQLTTGEVGQILDAQSQRLERLTQDHRQVVDLILRAVGNRDGQHQLQQFDPPSQQEQQPADPANVQNAFGPLQEMSQASKDIVPTMIQDDGKLAQFMESVASGKTRAMKHMQQRLREVSIAQSSIQRVLSSVAVLKDALQQQTENMTHLEHVEQLSDSYKHFLSELRRRRAYGLAVMSSSSAMMERLASMRSDEVKSREKFLRGPGRHLMPPFFEMFAPTLATPPPLFTPQLPSMVELDTMPDVGPQEGSTSTSATQQENDDATMMPVSTTGDQGVVSTSASTLTAESGGRGPSKHDIIAEVSKMTVDDSKNDASEAGSRPAEVQQRADQQQQDHLIVSADDGNDLILGDGDGDPSRRAAEDAERKTLAYENAVLRQALERMGGKPPKAYLDEAAAESPTTATAASDATKGVVEALRKELAEANAAAESAQIKADALEKKEAQRNLTSKDGKIDDRISHSSFSVGDVGLFMPTGRGSGGKRTYLAFHTNCPHRYLSTDNISGSPDFVLGRIVYQEDLIAGEVGTDANPYGLHVGTKFWVLTVEVLNPNLASASANTSSEEPGRP